MLMQNTYFIIFFGNEEFSGPVMKAINLRVLFFWDVAAVSSDTRIKKLTHRIKSHETTATHPDRLLDEKKKT